jgi:hypothetical protein
MTQIEELVNNDPHLQACLKSKAWMDTIPEEFDAVTIIDQLIRKIAEMQGTKVIDMRLLPPYFIPTLSSALRDDGYIVDDSYYSEIEGIRINQFDLKAATTESLLAEVARRMGDNALLRCTY